jgi:hypothetical protein
MPQPLAAQSSAPRANPAGHAESIVHIYPRC